MGVRAVGGAEEHRSGAPRLLVLRPGAIGDTILTYPALLHLRERFPDASVHLVGNPAAVPILAGQRGPDGKPLLQAWTAFDHPAVTGLFVPGGPPVHTTRAVGPLAAAVAWCTDSDGVLGESLRRLGATQLVVAPSRPPAESGTHVADHLLATLQGLGSHSFGVDPAITTFEAPDCYKPPGPRDRVSIPPLDVAPEWSVRAVDVLSALGIEDSPFVLVHPGSGSPTKNWPVERFARVVHALPDALGAAPVVLAGPAEAENAERLAAALSLPASVLRDLQLTVVAGLIRHARAYVGNDSGLTHLAGLVGTPTLALFGPTDPVMWAPLGPRVRVLRRQPLEALTVDAVLANLDELVRASV